MATDTLNHLTEAAVPGAEAAAKPNVFSEVFGFLGNHHSIDFMPIGKVSLPYMFFDNGSFHYFSSEEALTASGQYTTETSPTEEVRKQKEASPVGEKGGARGLQVIKDSKGNLEYRKVDFDFSITSNLCFLLLGTLFTFLIVRVAASK